MMKEGIAPTSLARLTHFCLIGYVATLPLLNPRIAQLPGGKVLVLADLAFAVLVMVILGRSFKRLLPIQPATLLVSLCPLAAVAVSTVCSGAGGRGLLDILRVAYSITVFLLFAHYRLVPVESVAVARAWVVTAVVVSALGLVGYLGVTVFDLPPSILARANSPNLGDGVVRIASTLGSSATALYLQTAAVLCLFLIGRPETNAGERRVLWVAFVGLLVTAFLTLSRSFIGLVLSVALISFLARRRLPVLWRIRYPFTWLAGLLVAAGVVATIWAVVPVTVNWDRDRETASLELNARKNAYYVIHAASLRMFRAHPLVGVGPGLFGDRFMAYTTPEERRTSWPPLPGGFGDPHSSWFGWAAKGGLMALGGWLVCYAWLLARLLPRAASEDAFSLRRLVGMGLIGILLNGFHIEITHLKFVWMFLGIGIGAQAAKPEAAVPALSV